MPKMIDDLRNYYDDLAEVADGEIVRCLAERREAVEANVA